MRQPKTNGAHGATAVEPHVLPEPQEGFVAPQLHKYTDMQELLLLDPIHDVDQEGWPATTESNADTP